MKKQTENSRLIRAAFWASAAFYGLIALEFFYMFSPFAAYLYGVYGPGLNVLSMSDSTSWLIAFYMPHIARETRSFMITWHEAIGLVLFLGGLLMFLFGAARIYWSKLKRKGGVFGGIYRHIRHPQYLALMVSGFGMSLVWPRYLVLLGFVTVCFTYFLLARLEEKICMRKLPDYSDYAKTSGMFLPRDIEKLFRPIPWPQTVFPRALFTFGLYVALLALAFALARGLHSYSINTLYTYSAADAIFVSVGKLEQHEFEALDQIAKSDPEVATRIAQLSAPDTRYINYVMPTDLLISEVPMHIPEGRVPSHQSPTSQDQTRYKIIYTHADFGPAETARGKDILRRAINKSPVLEVWIDRPSGQVERILEPPATEIYGGMPVPIF